MTTTGYRETYSIIVITTRGSQVRRSFSYAVAQSLMLSLCATFPAACISVVRDSDGGCVLSSASVRLLLPDFEPQIAAA